MVGRGREYENQGVSGYSKIRRPCTQLKSENQFIQQNSLYDSIWQISHTHTHEKWCRKQLSLDARVFIVFFFLLWSFISYNECLFLSES